MSPKRGTKKERRRICRTSDVSGATFNQNGVCCCLLAWQFRNNKQRQRTTSGIIMMMDTKSIIHRPAPTQRPAQPAPSSLAAVPPPAPAPHAGICSVQISMNAQDSKIYSYVKKMLARRFLYLHMFEMLPLVRYTAHKQTCIHKQIARMQTLENWKWKRNKVLRTTVI